MISRLIRNVGAVVLLALVAAPVFAADKVTGTFIVEGKTVRFTEVYASLLTSVCCGPSATEVRGVVDLTGSCR